MPKVEVSFESGQIVSDEWKESLLQHFGPREVERLERLGGRLTFALTVPFANRGSRPNSPIFSDSEISVLQSLSNNKEALREHLASYDAKTLRLACSYFGIAVSKKTPRVEMIAEIVRSLGNSAMWDAISRH